MRLCPNCQWHTVADHHPKDRVCGHCAANACADSHDRWPLVGVLLIMASATVSIAGIYAFGTLLVN